MQQAQQLQLFTTPTSEQELAELRKQIARLESANLALSMQNKALRARIDELESQNRPEG